MGRRAFSRALLAACSALLLGGCYTYHTVQTPDVGSTVRVQVSVSSALDRPNAAPRSEAVEGQVVAAGDTLVLSMRTRREMGAYREIVQIDTLRLARDQATTVEVQEFSPAKSIALGVVIGVGAGVAAVLGFNAAGAGSQGTRPPGGEPPAFTVSPSFFTSLWGLIAG